MTEQRRHARFTVELAAEVEIRGETIVAATNDISKGGVGLILDRALRERSTVKVILFLTQDGIEDPDEEPFEAQAEVMWAAEQEAGRFVAGVRFGALSAAQSSQLERFLAVLET